VKSASLRSGLALAAITVAYLLPWPFSLMNFDLARDVAIASAVARGSAWPMQGPILAGAVHAGPLWYYLFALPFAFVPSVLPALLWIGALAALKIPLAYLIGARFVDRPTGLLWALLLIFPGWETYEGITVLHPSLVATCTLAFLWFALNYARDGRPAHLLAAGFSLAMALHAHPSTYGLAFLLLAAIACRHRRVQQPLRDYGLLGVVVLAPFLPYVLFQAHAGYPDWHSAAGYLTNERNLGTLRSVPNAVAGLFVTGPASVVAGFAARTSELPWIVTGGYGLFLVLAASGLLLAVADDKRRPAAVFMAAAFIVMLLAVVAIRADTPYHMAYVLWVFASGLLALGLRTWLDIRLGRSIALLAIAFASVGTAVVQFSVARSLATGAYGFTLLPLFDIKQPLARGLPMPFVPAYALAGNGERLCAAPDMTTHGALAVHLLHDYAIEARLACRDVSGIGLGGNGAAGSTHWVGISQTIAETLALPIDVWMGPVGIAPVAQVVPTGPGMRVPALEQYPPATDLNDLGPPVTVEFDAAPDEIVLVTNLYFTFSAEPAIVATANGAGVPAAARDQIASAYTCARCPRDSPVRWRFAITAPALDRIDIVTIVPRAKR
jgi:hypothetical protein